jgi:CRISPR-associated protein Csm1
MVEHFDELGRLTIAALLCDIGRLLVRASNTDDNPRDVGAGWLNEMGLSQIAQDIGKWKDILTEATTLALGCAPPEENKDRYYYPLVSSFSKVSLTPDKTYHDCWSYFPAARMSPSPVFPADAKEAAKKKVSQTDYASLREDFESEIRSMKENITPDNLILLLEKYTSFLPYLPSDAADQFSDIPFFDQAKLTAAIASCLYCSITEAGDHLESNIANEYIPRFLLVGGDFSGVQPFIYNISSKGALKGLRGRSFFLELFTEHVIYEILAPLGLSRANIIFAGGSRFDLLLPKSASAERNLEQVRQEVNDYLWTNHGGRLCLVLEWVEFASQALAGEGLPKVFSTLQSKIAAGKQHKFSQHLHSALKEAQGVDRAKKQSEIEQRLNQGKEQWTKECPRCGKPKAPVWRFHPSNEEVMGCSICLDPDRMKFDECEVCHREDFLLPLPYRWDEIKGGDIPLACPFCCDLFNVGKNLPAIKYILRVKKEAEEGKTAVRIADVNYVLLDRVNKELFSKAEAIWMVNNLDDPRYWKGKAYPFLLAVYPTEKEDPEVPTEFKELAQQAVGAKKIAALRMDVDNLGKIATGMGFAKPEERNSLARLSTLSRYMTNFFKLYINEFCRGKSLLSSQTKVTQAKEDEKGTSKRNVVVIYSGGDDVFLVGAWSDVAEFAFDLHYSFDVYTSRNPDVTLSAGMVVKEHNYPIHHLAEDAGKAEESAKDNKDEKEKRKNSFAPLFKSHIFPKGDTLASHPAASNNLKEELRALLQREETKSALKWAQEDTPTAASMLELVKWLAKELGDGEKDAVLQLKPGARALIYKLLNVVEMRRRKGKLFLPSLYYALSRSKIDGRKISPELETLLLNSATITYLHPALTWLDLLGREK